MLTAALCPIAADPKAPVLYHLEEVSTLEVVDVARGSKLVAVATATEWVT